MIDYRATKTVELNGNRFTIGKVSKKVFAMFMAAYYDCVAPDENIAVAYNYIPFFLAGCTVDGCKMPAPTKESDGRTTVKHADYQWIADNIEGPDMIELVKECVEFNTVSSEKKTD